jgi:hypothetical protein
MRIIKYIYVDSNSIYVLLKAFIYVLLTLELKFTSYAMILAMNTRPKLMKRQGMVNMKRKNALVRITEPLAHHARISRSYLTDSRCLQRAVAILLCCSDTARMMETETFPTITNVMLEVNKWDIQKRWPWADMLPMALNPNSRTAKPKPVKRAAITLIVPCGAE